MRCYSADSTKLIKSRIRTLLLLLILLVPAILNSRIVSGRVVAVLDGDTIEIFSGRQTYRIRLDGIDCPEKRQAFGNRAKITTSELCFGTVVSANILDTDRYGRYIAKIILPDGRVLNEEMLRLGLAWHYKQYNNEARYANLENSARRQRAGLWSDPSPVAPWTYRRGGSPQHSQSVNATFVGSRNSNKYHLPTCQWAQRINASNLVTFSSKQDAESRGYIPCRVCRP